MTRSSASTNKIPTNRDGWMICDFTSFSTVFQSYQDDEKLIMKSVYNGTTFTVEKISPRVDIELGQQTGTSRDVHKHLLVANASRLRQNANEFHKYYPEKEGFVCTSQNSENTFIDENDKAEIINSYQLLTLAQTQL